MVQPSSPSFGFDPSQPPVAYGYRQPMAGVAPPLAARAVRLSAGLFVPLIIGGYELAHFGLSWVERKRGFGASSASLVTAAGAGLAGVFGLVTAVAYCVLVYRMWSAIDDGHARVRPGQAVGYLFIPFFNLYWMFRALPGWATDYNAYCERHGIASRASFGVMLAPVLVIPIPSVLSMMTQSLYGNGMPAMGTQFVVGLLMQVLWATHFVAYTWMVIHVCDRVRALSAWRR